MDYLATGSAMLLFRYEHVVKMKKTHEREREREKRDR
jgi:hypothetical protein